jgi:outer membrane receptor protein involved in Fe transport
VAVEQIFARTARVDVAFWHRRMTHVADPNVFFGSTIIFPNSVAEGHASGLDVRVELPRRAGWSSYVSYTNSRVEQVGPVTGGLFLEEEVIEIGPGTRFTPDHDQRHVAAAGLTYDHGPTGFWAAMTGRYESGTPLEVDDDDLDELLERPGAELIDIARGRVRPRTILDVMAAKRVVATRRADLTLRLSVLNATGARWAYNFGNPFSGTHFGPGRTFQVSARASFR